MRGDKVGYRGSIVSRSRAVLPAELQLQQRPLRRIAALRPNYYRLGGGKLGFCPYFRCHSSPAAASKTTTGIHRKSSDPAYPRAQTSIEISGGPAGGDGQSKVPAYQTAHTRRTAKSNEPISMSQPLSDSLSGCFAPPEYMAVRVGDPVSLQPPPRRTPPDVPATHSPASCADAPVARGHDAATGSQSVMTPASRVRPSGVRGPVLLPP
jgi:hypothetical protein